MLVMEEHLLTIAEVARFLRMREESIARLLRQGKIPGAFKVAGEWRISQRDFEAHIERQKNIVQQQRQKHE
jgi:excisionase family DNA binding protein